VTAKSAYLRLPPHFTVFLFWCECAQAGRRQQQTLGGKKKKTNIQNPYASKTPVEELLYDAGKYLKISVFK